MKKVKGDIEKHSTRNMGGGASVFSAAPNQSTKRKRQDDSIQERKGRFKRNQKESPSVEDELTKGLVFNYLKDLISLQHLSIRNKLSIIAC